MKIIAIGSVLLLLCAAGSFAGPVSKPQPDMPKPTGTTQFCLNTYAFEAQIEQANVDYKDGIAELQARKYISAETCFRVSLSSSLNGTAYLGLAEALAGQGRMADARQAYWLLFHPDAHHSWGGSYIPKADLEYALLLNQTGNWVEAVAHYNHAMPDIPNGGMRLNVRLDAGSPQPAALAAAAHISLGLYDNFEYQPDSNMRAFQEYSEALQIAPNWDVANYYYGYGWQHLSPAERAKFGTVHQAKAHLQKAEKTGSAPVKAAAQKALKELG